MRNSTNPIPLPSETWQIVMTRTEMETALGFIRDVVSGKIPVSPQARLKAAMWTIERSCVPPFDLRDVMLERDE